MSVLTVALEWRAVGDVLRFRKLAHRPRLSFLALHRFLSFVEEDAKGTKEPKMSNTKWIVALVVVAGLVWYICKGRQMNMLSDGTPPAANPLGT